MSGYLAIASHRRTHRYLAVDGRFRNGRTKILGYWWESDPYYAARFDRQDLAERYCADRVKVPVEIKHHTELGLTR